VNPRLKMLLAFVGTATVGVGSALVSVYLPKEDVTRAQLLDAGITDDCNQIALFCDAEIDGDARPQWRDAGFSKRFARLGIPGFRCPAAAEGGGKRIIEDGGLILPPGLRQLVRRGLRIYLDDCEFGPCADNRDVCGAAVFGDNTPFVVKPPTHVHAPMDGGTSCQRRERLPDGGTRVRYFGAGNVFPVGEAVGSGCVPSMNAADSDHDDL